MQLLKREELTPSEEHELHEVFSHPIVGRYLQVLAHNLAVDYAMATPDLAKPSEEYVRIGLLMKGQLDILNLLQSAHVVAVANSGTHTISR